MLITEHLNIALQGQSILKYIDLMIEPGYIGSMLRAPLARWVLKDDYADYRTFKHRFARAVDSQIHRFDDRTRLHCVDFGAERRGEIHLDEKPERRHPGRLASSHAGRAAIKGIFGAGTRQLSGGHAAIGSVFGFLLVSEVIEMSLLTAVSHYERAAYVERALAMFDVTHLKDRNYLTLSGGEQQRVQLARVIAQITHKADDRNRYLFLDECTSSLDLAHQHQVFEVVTEVVKTHRIAAIMVLHDLNLASQYSDRLVLMNQGEIVSQGTVDEVLQEERITDVYGYPVKVTPTRKAGRW